MSLEEYLNSLVEYCMSYDAFSIPAAMFTVESGSISLLDVYTELYVQPCIHEESNQEERELYQAPERWVYEYDITERINLLENTNIDLNTLKDQTMGKASENANPSDEKESPLSSQENEPNHKYDVDAKMILAGPGGGKTTLLKMYALGYAFLMLGKKLKIKTRSEEIQKKNETAINNICGSLEIKEQALPVVIPIRSLKNEMGNTFEEIAIRSMAQFPKMENERLIKELLYSYNKIVIIIDGLEEFNNREEQEKFYEKLLKYIEENDNRVVQLILSSRYREHVEADSEQYKSLKNSLELKEYIIQPFDNNFDLVIDFSKKWYMAIADVGNRREMDVERDFLNPLKGNPDIKSLATNPLELTSLLMISSFDSCLPSDLSRIYARSVELWLTWNNDSRYNIEDVTRQLAQIAYQMAVSGTDKFVVERERLTQMAIKSRKGLERYLTKEKSIEPTVIDDFISYIEKTGIMIPKLSTFEFNHRQYQAYLVAFCIKHNFFSREERHEDRFDYIKNHINDSDDFWTSIIVFLAIMDVSLRDKIIEELIKLVQNEGAKKVQYGVSMLIELAAISNINFDEREEEELFDILLKSENLFIWRNNRASIKKLLNSNDKRKNKIFLDGFCLAMEKQSKEKDSYIDTLGDFVFYTLWKCEVEEEEIEKIFSKYLNNWINMNCIREIQTSVTDYSYKERAYDILESLFRSSLNDELRDENDLVLCSFIVSAVYVYSCRATPFETINSLIEKNCLETNVIAGNILFLATWLDRDTDSNKFGFDWEKGKCYLNDYVTFISNVIANTKNRRAQQEFISICIEFCLSGFINGREDICFNTNVLNSILELFIQKWITKKDIFHNGDLLRELNGDLLRELRLLFWFPMSYSDKVKNYLNDKMDLEEFGDELQDVLSHTDDTEEKIILTKLLILMIEISDETKLSLLQKLESVVVVVTRKKYTSYKTKEALIFFEKIKEDLILPEFQNVNTLLAEKYNVREIKLQELNAEEINSRIINDLPFDSFETMKVETVRYLDYYAAGEYELEKQKLLQTFQRIESRNYLAYMLRRHEIDAVEYNGKSYSVEELLEEGIESQHAFSLVNYALNISFENNQYNYSKGLSFLKEKTSEYNSLLEVEGWWKKIRDKGELEGHFVCAWLCELTNISNT